jgi:hypothetical protein
MWGRLAGVPSGSGRLAIGLPAAPTVPEECERRLQLAALWGTVENLASTSRDLAAGRCINIWSGEVCPGEVFITFGGPQGHDDRMASCGGLATRLPVICTTAASQGPIANRPQDGIRMPILPRIAASRKPTAIGLGDYGQVAAGRLPIGRTQRVPLPTCPTRASAVCLRRYRIVAAREDWNEL